jgi:low temperature requirement protein LtrA
LSARHNALVSRVSPQEQGLDRLLGPLRLRTVDDPQERHASALELFFDLVFVLAVAALADTLSADRTAIGFVHYGALFVPVWWAWVGYTFYADRFETDDVAYRLLVLAAMLAIAAVAVTTERAFADAAGAHAFALSYVAIRAILIVLYVRAFAQEPRARPLCGRYLLGFVAGAALWAASALVAPPATYVLWGAGMVVELLTPLLSAAAIKRVPYHASHIPERLGAFTIIVLGETVLLAATGVAAEDVHVAQALVAALGFLIAACMWWSYFEALDDSPLRRWLFAGQTYLYGHLLIFAGVAATGVGVLAATRAVHAGALDGGGRWALCGGVAAYLTAMGAIRLVDEWTVRDGAGLSRLVAAALAAGIAAAGTDARPTLLVALVLALLLAHVVAESRRRP